MRTNVSFRFVTDYVGAEESADILGVNGVGWFVDRLRRIPHLSLAKNLIQEDWGVVVLAERRKKRFWIGVSVFGDDTWIAHVHHRSFAFLQRVSLSGRREFDALANDLHVVLTSDPAISDVRWYRQKDLMRSPYDWSAAPKNA